MTTPISCSAVLFWALAFLAAGTVADAGASWIEEDNCGASLVQTHHKALKSNGAALREPPLQLPRIETDVANASGNFDGYVLGDLSFSRALTCDPATSSPCYYQQLMIVPPGEASSVGTAGSKRVKRYAFHSIVPPKDNWKVYLATPFVMIACFLFVRSLKKWKTNGQMYGGPPKDTLVIHVAVFFTMLGGQMIFPMTPFIAIDFGATPSQIGVMDSSFGLTQFFCTLIIGALSDKIGRRKMVLALPIGHTFCHLWCATSTTWNQFLAGRLLLGCCSGLIPICEALVCEQAEKEHRAAELGRMMAAMSLGGMAGPGFASLLVPIGTANIFYITAALALVIWMWLIWSYGWIYYDHKAAGAQAMGSAGTAIASQEDKPLSYGNLAFWCFVTFVSCAIAGLAVAMNPLFFLEQYGIAEKEMGIMFMVSGGLAIFAQSCLTGFFTARFGNILTIIIGQACALPFGFMLVLLHFPALPWICMVCSTMTGALINPTTAAEVANTATDKNRGSLMGIYQSVRALGGSLGPVMGGRVYQHNIFLPFWIGNCWAVVILALSFSFYYFTTKSAPAAVDKPQESGTTKLPSEPSEISQDDNDTKPPSETEIDPAETQRDPEDSCSRHTSSVSHSRDRSLSGASAEAYKPVEDCHA